MRALKLLNAHTLMLLLYRISASESEKVLRFLQMWFSAHIFFPFFFFEGGTLGVYFMLTRQFYFLAISLFRYGDYIWVHPIRNPNFHSHFLKMKRGLIYWNYFISLLSTTTWMSIFSVNSHTNVAFIHIMWRIKWKCWNNSLDAFMVSHFFTSRKLFTLVFIIFSI